MTTQGKILTGIIATAAIGTTIALLLSSDKNNALKDKLNECLDTFIGKSKDKLHEIVDMASKKIAKTEV